MPVANFDASYVINLDHRTDRLEQFKRGYPDDHFPSITRWPGHKGDEHYIPSHWLAGSGAWGCYQSHLQVLVNSLYDPNIQSYVVFEDDACFKRNPVYLTDVLNDLPEDWEMLYLGGQLLFTDAHPPERVSRHVYRPYNVNRTHAFAVNGKPAMQKLYDWLTKEPFHKEHHIDHHLGRLHEQRGINVYCPSYWIVGQSASTSSINGRYHETTYFPDPVSEWRRSRLHQRGTVVLFHGPQEVAHALQAHGYPCGLLGDDGYPMGVTRALRSQTRAWTFAKWYRGVQATMTPDDLYPMAFHPHLTAEQVQSAELSKVIEVRSSTLDDALLQLKAAG